MGPRLKISPIVSFQQPEVGFFFFFFVSEILRILSPKQSPHLEKENTAF